MDWINVLLPLLLAPAKIVSGPRANSVSSRIDLKLNTFHFVIIHYSFPFLLPLGYKIEVAFGQIRGRRWEFYRPTL